MPPKQVPLAGASSSASNFEFVPLSTEAPRVVLYQQTHHNPNGDPVSLLPLVTKGSGITHLILAALHINPRPENITLNDNRPGHPRFQQLWSEVQWLKGAGVKVMMMLGGAARGSYERLGGDEEQFETYYLPLLRILRNYQIDGIDLDIEESVPLSTPVRLIRRLRADMGPSFIITLAPVATALLEPLYPAYAPFPSTPIPGHLSGFSYAALEREVGEHIAWYNTQFYNGWGDASSVAWYLQVLARGWNPRKVVFGVLTNAAHGGSGFVGLGPLTDVLRALHARLSTSFGGVMGWEYWRSNGTGSRIVDRNLAPGPKGHHPPWHWVRTVALTIRGQNAINTISGGRGVERPGIEGNALAPGLVPPPAQAPFPEKDIAFLCEMGIERSQAIAAMNMTNGNVDQAAGILFDA